jgi:hypothetical protein
VRQRGTALPIALSTSQVMAVPLQAPPKIYENAHLEKVSCAGLEKKYDESPNNLILTFNLLHLRRLVHCNIY